MYASRFFIWASLAVSSAGHFWAIRADRCFLSKTCRSGGNWFCSWRIGPSRSPNHMGARLCFTPREWSALCARPAVFAHHAACLTRHRQPSSRCALDYGRSRNLRKSICGYRRSAWRTSRIEFHVYKTPCDAGRCVRCTALSDPKWRSRCAERSTYAVAGGIAALPAQSARLASPWRCPMGSGPIPRKGSESEPLGGAL